MKLKVLPVTDGIAWKSTKAQAWSTTVKEAGSGKERVLTNWAYPRWTIETSYSILTPEAGDLLYDSSQACAAGTSPFYGRIPSTTRSMAYSSALAQAPKQSTKR